MGLFCLFGFLFFFWPLFCLCGGGLFWWFTLLFGLDCCLGLLLFLLAPEMGKLGKTESSWKNIEGCSNVSKQCGNFNIDRTVEKLKDPSPELPLLTLTFLLPFPPFLLPLLPRIPVFCGGGAWLNLWWAGTSSS